MQLQSEALRIALVSLSRFGLSMTHPVIEVKEVTKELKMGQHTIHALRGVNMLIQRGEMVGIVGPSGSGKSTLLGIIGGLDTPTKGQVFIDGL